LVANVGSAEPATLRAEVAGEVGDGDASDGLLCGGLRILLELFLGSCHFALGPLLLLGDLLLLRLLASLLASLLALFLGEHLVDHLNLSGILLGRKLDARARLDTLILRTTKECIAGAAAGAATLAFWHDSLLGVELAPLVASLESVGSNVLERELATTFA